MINFRTYWVIIAGALLFVLSAIALLVNQLYYHYPGNNYFPPQTFFVIVTIGLTYLGCLLQWGRHHIMTQSVAEINLFFMVMSAIALAANAAQLTPFPPIDGILYKLENKLHIDMPAMMGWVHERPYFEKILTFAYDSLAYQMCYLPILFILARKLPELREYYFLLLSVSVLGFICYYFFPTTAPASVVDSVFFLPDQKDTGLKFYQIHHHIQPTTMNGGLVSLPSFHVMWAYCCLSLLKTWRWAFIMALPLNCLLIVSCVLLGWHYLIDIIIAILFFELIRGFYNRLRALALDKMDLRGCQSTQ